MKSWILCLAVLVANVAQALSCEDRLEIRGHLKISTQDCPFTELHQGFDVEVLIASTVKLKKVDDYTKLYPNQLEALARFPRAIESLESLHYGASSFPLSLSEALHRHVDFENSPQLKISKFTSKTDATQAYYFFEFDSDDKPAGLIADSVTNEIVGGMNADGDFYCVE